MPLAFHDLSAAKRLETRTSSFHGSNASHCPTTELSCLSWTAQTLSQYRPRRRFESSDGDFGCCRHRANHSRKYYPEHDGEWPAETPLPKDLIASVERSAPGHTVILTKDKDDRYISGMKFRMVFAPITTVGSRESPKTSIRAPVGPPTLAVSYKCTHVLAPTVWSSRRIK